ncbi:STYKc [Musa troglodytarum]|uniref:non-specific serine/threonine protein kinase n=1 Tax=Musa troglodytarum TaxID=320322 RepID=A0A9E7ETW6_9LILI|nr:STYKc [Musa troglodytarum]
MGCFHFIRERNRYRKRRASAPMPSSVPMYSPTSNEVTSRSEDSTTAKQTSKSSGSVSSQKSIPELYEERAHNLRVFELKELRNATNDFSRLLKIGEGGFGSVYKGFVKPPDRKGDGTIVAIKKLNPQGLQGHKQWLAEVQFLGVVEHPNLVKLIGYCSVDSERVPQRMLVYEFMPNKSLEDHLFNRAYPSLPWSTRLQVALRAAEGLAYLHEGMDVQVIYRDFKASNVLLDEEFRPKLSDFGLAREGPSEGHTHVTTAVRMHPTALAM